MQGELTGCNDLDSLFRLWKEEQKREEDFEKTTIDGISKTSFTKDGIISEECYKNAKCKILFILKESNLLNYQCGRTSDEDDQICWYKDFIGGKVNDNIPKQREKMGRMAFYLFNKNNLQSRETPTEEEYKKALKSVAFMNLNKRGGGKSVDVKRFPAYVQRYKEFIFKEIELIDPDYIIVLGKTNFANEIRSKYGDKVITMWHTAYKMPNQKRSENPKISKDRNVDCYMRHFFEIAKYL